MKSIAYLHPLTNVDSVLVNIITDSAAGNSLQAFDRKRSHRAVFVCCRKLTGDKLCSLPELVKDEVGQHVKASKQENTDLQKKQRKF